MVLLAQKFNSAKFVLSCARQQHAYNTKKGLACKVFKRYTFGPALEIFFVE